MKTIQVKPGKPSRFYLNNKRINLNTAFGMYQKGAKFTINGKKLNLNKFGAGMGDLPYELQSQIAMYAAGLGSRVNIPTSSRRPGFTFVVDDDRLDAPDRVKIEEWRNEEGRLHRVGGPAKILYRVGDDRPYREMWYKNGLLHRVGGPARIQYNQDGSYDEEWYTNGLPYREDGPTYLNYSADGNVVFEGWFNSNGQPHREDRPAAIEYSPDGTVEREDWYKNGKLHREDGPARVFRSPYEEEWYWNGKNMSPKEYYSRQTLQSGRNRVKRAVRLLTLQDAAPRYLDLGALSMIGEYM